MVGPSQPADPNPETLSVTTDQLKMLVFKSLEQMLNAGGNLEENPTTTQRRGC